MGRSSWRSATRTRTCRSSSSRRASGKPEYAAVQKRLRAKLKAWQRLTNDPLADPAKLAALTQEHDAITKAYYKAGIRGGSRRFQWHYHQYLRGD